MRPFAKLVWTVVCIQSTFDNIIRSNTNTLFGPVFGPNRIQKEHLVQPYLTNNKG